MKAITEFDGEHRFLSNFYPARVAYDGEVYSTVEHAYQAAKLEKASDRAYLRMIGSPGAAKRVARDLPHRTDVRWVDVKLDIMESLVRQKFSVEPLRSMLLATGDANLVEGNTWGDRFWGVSGGVGRNHLGRILMKVRDQLKTAQFARDGRAR